MGEVCAFFFVELIIHKEMTVLSEMYFKSEIGIDTYLNISAHDVVSKSVEVR